MRTQQHHHVLTNGVGKCSVPMWMNGLPAGFCDEPAYGPQQFDGQGQSRYGDFDWGTRKWINYYVPGLACYGHGGPKPTTTPPLGG
jgi:hypothetical protein